MSAIYVPSRFANQPQIVTQPDYHGLARGAKLILNPALGQYDIAQKVPFVVSGAVTKSTTKHGVVTNHTGGSKLTSTGYLDLIGAPCTYAVWLPSIGASDTAGHIYISLTTSLYMAVRVADGFVGFNSQYSTSGITGWFSTTDRSMVITTNGTAASTKCYIDGIDSGLAWSVAPNTLAAGSKTIWLGAYHGINTYDFEGQYLVAHAGTRVWSDADAQLFHDSRGNALYESPNRAIYYSATAPPSVNLDFFNPPLTGGMNSMQGNFQG